MKPLFLITFLMLLGNVVNAQPVNGKYFIGGTLSLDFRSSEYTGSGGTGSEIDKRSHFSLWPTVGYFLNDKMAVGTSLGFTVISDKPEDLYFEKSFSTRAGISPFFRYYLISGTGGIFAEASIYAGFGKTKNDYVGDISETDNIFSYSIGITPGAYYYITPKIALIGELGLLGFSSEITKFEDEDKEVDNNFNFDIHPSYISFGINVTL